MSNPVFHFAAAALAGQNPHEAGIALLTSLFRDVTGRPLPPIARTEYGKPYFPTESLHFSISHSQKHVFCVLSRVSVGIDAEEADRPVNLKLAEKILSSRERIRWDAAQNKRDALLRFWVLKEAAAKLSGKGLQGYPNHTDFSPDDPRVILNSGCLVAVLTNET